MDNQEKKPSHSCCSFNFGSKGFPPFGRTSKIAALVVVVLIIALGSFATGVFVGFCKARFSYKFGENYERNFTNRQFPGQNGMMGRGSRGMMGNIDGSGFRNGHGIAGAILSISGNNIVIKDRNGQENTITASDQTLIKRGQDSIKIGDLKQDEQIVVMGRPGDNGTLNADLIRVFDNVTNNNTNGQ